MYSETKVSRVRIPWTSDASGNATVHTNAVGGGILYGALIAAEFVPGTGTSQPSNNYAATLTNDNGTDLMSGQATGLSNATNSCIVGGCPIRDGTTTGTVPWLVSSALTLTISSAGNTKSGTLFLYFR